MTRFNLREPRHLLPEVPRPTADSVALAGVGAGLQNPAPPENVKIFLDLKIFADLIAPGDVANVGAEVLAAGAVLVRLEEGIVDGEEEDALPGPGVHHQLPEVARHRDLVLHQVHRTVVHLITNIEIKIFYQLAKKIFST